jgi:hypothetical protein
MKNIVMIVILLTIPILNAEYTSKDVLSDTLKPYGIDVVDVGVTSKGAVLIYEQRPTSSPARVISDATLAMVALADEYPETDMCFVIVRAGGHPVLAVYAKTKDILDYKDGKMEPGVFATKLYSKMLVPESGGATCCGTGLILLVLAGLIYVRYTKDVHTHL